MKKYFRCFIVTLMLVMLTFTTVNAKSSEKDLFQAGDKVSIDNKLDGTAFIAGNEIKVNNKILSS